MLDENQVIEEVEELQVEISQDTNSENKEEFDNISDSLGDDLSVEENNSKDIILQEINSILTSQDTVDYSDHFVKIEEKMDEIIFLKQQISVNQERIGNDIVTILGILYLITFYFALKYVAKLFNDIIFRHI